jgi:hypothetical protein
VPVAITVASPRLRAVGSDMGARRYTLAIDAGRVHGRPAIRYLPQHHARLRSRRAILVALSFAAAAAW